MDNLQLQQLAEKLEKQLSKCTEAISKADQNSETVKELNEKMADLGKEQLALAQKFLALQQDGIDKGSDQKSVTLGQQFVDSQSYKDFATGATRKASCAAIATPAGAALPVNGGIAAAPEMPLSIYDSFETNVPITSNSVAYLREVAFTNNAAPVAEAGTKPESNITFEEKVATVKTIAHWMRITKQLMADAPALAAYINARMQYGLEKAIDEQLANGNGTGTNIEGFFNAGAFTPHGMSAGADETILDLIRHCQTKINANGYNANKLYLNPMDFSKIRGMKDKNGSYLMGPPTQDNSAVRPWGLLVVSSSAVKENSFMVADTRMGATVYERQGTTIELFEQDANNVTENLVTIRAEARLAFAIESVNCFVGGSLAYN